MFLGFLGLLGEDGILKKPGKTGETGQRAARQAANEESSVNPMLIHAASAREAATIAVAQVRDCSGGIEIHTQGVVKNSALVIMAQSKLRSASVAC